MKDCNYSNALLCLAKVYISAELSAIGNKKVDKKELKRKALAFVEREIDSLIEKEMKKRG